MTPAPPPQNPPPPRYPSPYRLPYGTLTQTRSYLYLLVRVAETGGAGLSPAKACRARVLRVLSQYGLLSPVQTPTRPAPSGHVPALSSTIFHYLPLSVIPLRSGGGGACGARRA